jgi:glycosyltransferase involved in cell wall biosynthesis
MLTHRLAVVTTHPVQYYAPWFRHIAGRPGVELRVFYLWDFGVTRRTDRGFVQAVKWDIPLLDGYASEFVPNISPDPGTHHFAGIDNPTLGSRLDAFGPTAVLCVGYNHRSFLRLLRGSGRRREPLLLRGDSHRLVPARGVKAWAKRRLLTRLFRRFAAFLYVGQANREYYRLHGVGNERLFFAPHAVDNDRFMGARAEAESAARIWKRELGIPDGHTVVLFAGKFEPKKRPGDLLEAFRRAAVPNAALLFVGSGPLEGDLRQQAAQVPGVYFAPFQNQSRMPRTYAAGDMLVLPSFGPTETWGLCVNEAMCLGRPAIVSTHVGCAADLVTDGETGLVYPAGDVDGLAAAVRRACVEPDVRTGWGAAALHRVGRYCYAEATRGLLECLDRIPSRTAA